MTVTEHDAGIDSDQDVAGIDPALMATCLEVLAQVELLPTEHPAAVAVRRATAGIFKTVRKMRRTARPAAEAAADRAVIESTATGSPQRIDDETQGILLRDST